MGTAGFGLYVMVLSHLRDCPDCTAELNYDALGYELHEDPALIRRVVEDFGSFSSTASTVLSPPKPARGGRHRSPALPIEAQQRRTTP